MKWDGISSRTARTALTGAFGTAAVHLGTRTARLAHAGDLHFPRAIATALLPPKRGRRALGWTIFVASGVALAAGYRALLPRDRPRPLLGAAIGALHGVITVIGARALGPLHPRPAQAGLRRRGRIPPSDLAVLFGVHVLYGAILGGLLRRRGE